jgi:hypothetical protein
MGRRPPVSDASDLFLLRLAEVFQQHQRGTPATSCSRVIRLMRENPEGVRDLILSDPDPKEDEE